VSDWTTKAPFTQPAWLARVAENKLGLKAIPVPVYQYHASNDPIVTYGQGTALRDRYCALGVKVTFKTFDTGHVTTVARGVPDALAFLADRFADKPATSTC